MFSTIAFRSSKTSSQLSRLNRSLLALIGVAVTSAGFATTPPAQVSGQLYMGLTITGAVGSNYLVQCTPDLSQTNRWLTLTNFALPTSPYLWVDPSPSATAARFYRVIVPSIPTATPSNPNPARLVWIPPGSFVMGSPTNEAERSFNESQHSATLTSGFYISIYLTQQGEYASLIGTNPSYATAKTNLPVEQVSWGDAAAYCTALTSREQALGRLPTGWVYRLPTETEWEYACRALTTNAFYFGNHLKGGMANFDSEYEYDSAVGDIYQFFPKGNVGGTSPIGNYAANPWGLYDMCGNVWEWCHDWYGAYPEGPVYDPTGPATGVSHVMRGGSWGYDGAQCRSAQRGYRQSDNGTHDIGFRVVLAPALP